LKRKIESGILTGYIFIDPELLSLTRIAFSEKVGTGTITMHLKSQ
jgi:hypothetical protein